MMCPDMKLPIQMKSYIRVIAGLALALFLNTSVRGDGFIEEEERLYKTAVERQLAAPREELVNAGSPDKKVIRFALSVYGEYFGSSGIRASIDYCLYLKKQNLEDSDEFRLLEGWIRAWGRKSALTIIADPAHFSGPDKDAAFGMAEGIEGVRWKNLQKDALYLKTASFWNEVSKLVPLVAPGHPVMSIEKVVVLNDGQLKVGTNNGEFIVAKEGRATVTKGELASCDASLFTDLSDKEINRNRFSGAIAVDGGFGKNTIAWNDGEQHGLVQILRGKRLENGVELFVLKSTGYERPLMGVSTKLLADEDLSILAMRGKAVVDDYARKVHYQSAMIVSRFGSRLDPARLQVILAEKNGNVHDLEAFLVIYADTLPELPDEEVYRNYNNILKQLK